MSPKFIPVLGDLVHLGRYEEEGKYALNYTQDLAEKYPESKATLILIGNFPKLHINDLDTADKLTKMVGSKIDRTEALFMKPVFFWLSNSFIMNKSDEGWTKRRKMIAHHLGLHMTSTYIPLFVEEATNALNKWKNSKGDVEMMSATANITFNIISRLMF